MGKICNAPRYTTGSYSSAIPYSYTSLPLCVRLRSSPAVLRSSAHPSGRGQLPGAPNASCLPTDSVTAPGTPGELASTVQLAIACTLARTMVTFEQLPDEIISMAVEHMSFVAKKQFSLVTKRTDALTVSCRGCVCSCVCADPAMLFCAFSAAGTLPYPRRVVLDAGPFRRVLRVSTPCYIGRMFAHHGSFQPRCQGQGSGGDSQE